MFNGDSLGSAFSKGGGMSHNDDVIDFKTGTRFYHRKAGAEYVQMMRDMEMDAQITLPDVFVIELENGVTEKQIVDGYNKFISEQVKPPSSNRNDKKNPDRFWRIKAFQDCGGLLAAGAWGA